MSRDNDALIARFGFVTNSYCDNLYRTKGFVSTWKHPELEIRGQYVGVPAKLAHQIFTIAADEIKKGKKFLPDHNYDEFLDGFQVRVIDANGYLRLILPDKAGRVQLPMPHPFCHQYDPVPAFGCAHAHGEHGQGFLQ